MHGDFKNLGKNLFLFYFFKKKNPSVQYSFQQSQQNFADFDTQVLKCIYREE